MTNIAVYLLILFCATWAWGLLLAPSLIGTGDLDSLLASLLPNVWFPTVLAIIFTGIEGGSGGIKNELRARLRWPQIETLLLALVLPVCVIVIALASARFVGDGAAYITAAALPVALGIQLITGATGEELGWRGYLLPRLRERYGKLMAGTLMGGLWSLWHIPAFFTSGLPHQSIPMASFLAFVALFGILLSLLFFAAGESIIPTITAHLALNIMLALGGTQLSSVTFWRTAVVMTGIAVAVAIPYTGRNRRSA